MTTDKAQALRAASEILQEFGTPKSYDEAVRVVALAYNQGLLAGYVRAGEQILGVDLREAAPPRQFRQQVIANEWVAVAKGLGFA